MSLLWDLSDVLMGVMALINIPVILILSGTAFKALRDYEDQLKREVNPVFKKCGYRTCAEDGFLELGNLGD